MTLITITMHRLHYWDNRLQLIRSTERELSINIAGPLQYYINNMPQEGFDPLFDRVWNLLNEKPAP